MTSGRGLIPTTEEVLQNAGAFGAHLGFGSIAGYAAGKAMRAGTNIGLVLAGAGFIRTCLKSSPPDMDCIFASSAIS